MLLGYNYPFSTNHEGGDIGPDVNVGVAEWNSDNALVASGNVNSVHFPPLFDHIDRNLINLGAMGFKVIRWWLLGNGHKYGPPPVKNLIKNNSGFYDYGFIPPATIDPRFARDFTELLKRFEMHNLSYPTQKLQIIPSLISHGFGTYMDAGTDRVRNVGWRGRADVIRNKDKTKVFLDTMLDTLLQASAPYHDLIYAWEVINEPIFLCRGLGALSKPWYNYRTPEVSEDEMTAFLHAAITHIENFKDPTMAAVDPNKAAVFSGKSTVGHRYLSDLKILPTGSIPQFHYYNERYVVYDSDPNGFRNGKRFTAVPLTGLPNPSASPSTAKPILGEFDSDQNRYGTGWGATDFWSNNAYDRTAARLHLLENEGCDLAIIWPDLGGHPKYQRVTAATLKSENDSIDQSDKIKLLDVTRQGIVEYTKGTLPPANE